MKPRVLMAFAINSCRDPRSEIDGFQHLNSERVAARRSNSAIEQKRGLTLRWAFAAPNATRAVAINASES